MAKRFTDNQKWQDNWFTDLTNDQKIIWIYLLDNCDNAGLWKLNIRNLNFFCSTNITVEEFVSTFSKRLTQVGEDLFLINKFCVFQYGPDFLNNKSKPVLSAINRLKEIEVVTETKGIYTLTIPLPNPYLTTKDKDKDKDKDKEEDKDLDKSQVKEKVQYKFQEEEQDKSQDKDKVQVKAQEWEINETISSIKMNIKNEALRSLSVELVNGITLTLNQRTQLLQNKSQLVELVPALQRYLTEIE